MKGAEYCIGDTILRPRRELLRDGVAVPIGGQALEIISLLAEAQGALVSKDALFEAGWPGTIVEDNALQAQVSAARKALGPDASRIVTVHGRGYRLLLDDMGSAQPQRGAANPRSSVAVLPFANLTGDTSKQYLADGMAEEFITTLSKIDGVKVPARTSSFAYRDRDVDIRTIARELGVATVLEGSIRSAGERMRVTAQLIEAETGFHLWAENYDRRLDDIFALQDEIAGAVASAFRTSVEVFPARPKKLSTYHWYLQARLLAERGRAEDIAQSNDLMRRAVAEEPDFALGWAWLASGLLALTTTGILPVSARDEARACAEKARQIDPTLPYPAMVLGALDALGCRWVTAEAHFTTSLRLEPGESHCYSMYGYYVVASCGHLARAQQVLERAFELGPAVALHSLGRATIAGLRGEVGAMLSNLQAAETLGHSAEEPSIRALRAALSMFTGQWEQAAAHSAHIFPPAFRADGLEVARLVYRAAAGLGDRSEASMVATRLVDRLDAGEVLPRYQVLAGTIVQWQVMLDHIDAAFAALDRYLEAWRRTGQFPTLGLFPLWSPIMQKLREDPRFSDFGQALGMFDYWDRHGPPDGHVIERGRLICVGSPTIILSEADGVLPPKGIAGTRRITPHPF